MDSPRERVCPSCSAPAESKQRWCLECGAELPHSRRPALRSAVGIATTLTVLVGAASAGGYTLLQDGKEPPPPAQTIAQTPPPVPTTPETTPPPLTDETIPTTPSTPPLPDAGTRGGTNGLGGTGGTGGGGTVTPPPDTSNDVPDLSDDLDTSSPPPPPPPQDDTELDDDGTVRPDGSDKQDRAQRPAKPRLIQTDIALGAPTIAYAPYAGSDVDLGDPSRLVDGTTSTAWKTPRFDDPAAHPQMGVYVDLASPERLRKLIIKTPTPGMTVEIYAARTGPPPSITDPGWAHLATRQDLPADSTIGLPDRSKFRYVLVWITGLPPGGDQAAISELSLLSMQPE